MRHWLTKTYSPLLAVLWNLLLVYLVYQIARLVYYCENTGYLSYSWDIFRGGLLFDTSAILYTNVLYVVLMLFPFYKKENKKIIEKILLAPAHIIVTGRGKDEYVLEANSRGKMAPRKVGVGVQQDKDIEYEYMVTWMIDQDTHLAEAAKDNTHIFEGKIKVLDEKAGEALYDWANDGDPVKSPKERAEEVKRIQDEITTKATELGGSKNAEMME